MTDEDWISEGAAAGHFPLAEDRRIAARPVEAPAIHTHDARVPVFALGDLTATRMGDLRLEYGDRIHALGDALALLSSHRPRTA